jgi:hypothetical protein
MMVPSLARKEMEWGPVGQAAMILLVSSGKARCLAGDVKLPGAKARPPAEVVAQRNPSLVNAAREAGEQGMWVMSIPHEGRRRVSSQRWPSESVAAAWFWRERPGVVRLVMGWGRKA